MVTQLIVDALANSFDRTVCIDKVVEEDLAQVFERAVGLFLKSAVAVECRLRVKIGRTQFFNFADARLEDFFVMRLRFNSTVYLTLHALLLIDE